MRFEVYFNSQDHTLIYTPHYTRVKAGISDNLATSGSEANAEVPQTCIPATDQQGATPLVESQYENEPTVLLTWFLSSVNWLQRLLWGQLTGYKGFYGLSR